jgi:hypothetical protein
VLSLAAGNKCLFHLQVDTFNLVFSLLFFSLFYFRHAIFKVRKKEKSRTTSASYSCVFVVGLHKSMMCALAVAMS